MKFTMVTNSTNTMYQHFRKDEQTFIDWVQKRAVDCLEQYRPIVTNFLNPRQRMLVNAVIGASDEVNVSYYGGYEASELQRALIYPIYYEPAKEDFSLRLCTIHYPIKFAELSHSSILGTIIKTGIARDRIGDIIHENGNWQFITTDTMLRYLQQEVVMIGKVKVALEELSFDQIVTPELAWEDLQTTVSSLRADALIAQVCGYSRQRAKDLIDREVVKLNWAILNRPDVEVASEDMLSVRGFGRIAIKAIGNRTKKNRVRIDVKILKNKR